MGKIKKITENELIGGTQTTDVYPVTAVKAVYDENNERLDNILNRRSVVNISTNYNSEHIAEVLTLSQAISKISSADRVIGFQGKYLASDGWHTIIYTGDNLTNWEDKTKWVDLADKIFNSISNNATFAGIATPETNPGTPDGPVFYFASTEGTYSNFNGVVLNNPGLVVLYNLTGTWNSLKVSECLQELGSSTSSPMSQKATTEAIEVNATAIEANEQAIAEEKFAIMGIHNNSVIVSDETKSDLDIADQYGNVIAEFKDGHIKTKEFDSSNIEEENSAILGIHNTSAIVSDETEADLDIADQQGNVIAEFRNGHIKTKNFDSANINTNTDTDTNTGGSYKPRPSHGGKVFFEVEVNINLVKSEENMSTVDTYTKGIDHGYVALPSNYSISGKPTRLIICCHGAFQTFSSFSTDTSISGSVWRHWLSLGYAIMDMYGIPYELSGIEGGTSINNSDMHYGNPVTIQCYKKGYEYVIENYNICKDGVFVTGASMGGMSSVQIIQSHLFPVLAYVGYCPCIDTFKQAYCNPWVTPSFQRGRIAQYFGFEGAAPAWSAGKPANSEEIQYFKDNLQKVIGYYPIFMNVVSGDITKVFDYVPATIGVNNDFTGTLAQEQAFYDALTATCNCPVLIFHCLDDGLVAYRYSKYWVEMLRRSGQIAYLRTFTTGGHTAWDNGDTTIIKDIDGNNLSLSASKYEAYLFFKRFDS